MKPNEEDNICTKLQSLIKRRNVTTRQDEVQQQKTKKQMTKAK
jgi:hypothetical protein